jgi:hypothetical protein
MGRKRSTPAKDASAATPAAPPVEDAPVEATAKAAPEEDGQAKSTEMPVPDKRALGTRIFAHPQLDVIQDGHSVWIPGQEIHPADIAPDTWKRLLQDGLIVSEATYKLSFPELWNKAHPREQVGVPRTERGEIDLTEDRPVAAIK